MSLPPLLNLKSFVLISVLAGILRATPGCGNDPSSDEDVDDTDTDTDSDSHSYVVVDTRQSDCYGLTDSTPCPAAGNDYSGQDAQHQGPLPSYQDNGDGTVTDLNTGLMWQKGYESTKKTYQDAVNGADSLDLAGYVDWRLPTIKELFSLIVFTGTDPNPMSASTSGLVPFIDDAFDFRYGDTDSGERIIDAQYVSATTYTSTTMNNNPTVFGVNFADGRIKGYPQNNKTFEVKYVRGNTRYGANDFLDNGDETITDQATLLMWSKTDSGEGLTWAEALAWTEEQNAAQYLGHDDWRLPNVKELQSIVDYTRSPDHTGGAAINPLFDCEQITGEGGAADYAQYWSSTTHLSASSPQGGTGSRGAYVCFGRCLGYWQGSWTDVHGAGAQRSDPKAGNPADFPTGLGPQGDAIRIYNHVRLVRDAE